MKVSFYNLGCKVNLADISRIGKQFEDLGHNIVDFDTQSDIVLINTCTVTHRADADCRKIARRALKKSPNAFVGVLGCFAQLQPEEIIKIVGVDAVFGQKEKFKIPELITNFSKNDKAEILVSELDDIPFHTSAVSDNAGKTRAVFKIQDGCEYNCTFCTIPMARGGFRSLNFDELEENLLKFKEQNFKEVVYSGINLGEYKSDNGEKFFDILKKTIELDLGIRYRISSIEPNLLKDNIIELVANSDAMCNHFHIPLQSGSQEILMKMKRRYRAKNYEKLINKIKNEMPDACIGADLIVGFPGESDDLFEESYDFINSLSLSYLHVFTYSERPNTIALNIKDIVPHKIRKERTKRLRELSDKKLKEFYISQVGTKRIVIPETYVEHSGLWKAWTENYVSVLFEADKSLSKEPIEVELLEYRDNKVFGKLI